jgi:hypothetical protein
LQFLTVTEKDAPLFIKAYRLPSRLFGSYAAPGALDMAWGKDSAQPGASQLSKQGRPAGARFAFTLCAFGFQMCQREFRFPVLLAIPSPVQFPFLGAEIISSPNPAGL